MTTIPRRPWVHRFGEWAGRMWRWLVRQDRRASAWLTRQGLSAGAAKSVSWAVKLLVLVVVLYAAFWLALLLALLVIAGLAASHIDGSAQEESPLSDESDHKKNPFYDPINYNDDPDPRFDDK
ncbi:Uncharacterised protein [Burkholderia pseudomallei]|uniref:DUF3742 family protein n=1 Tax=Burkholderia pseudomallei TaxID=28450 RepID=UPI0005E5BE45|nr:DUF3742 family protein [Burkholderia pseudomallei]TPB79363.1 DUF3742 domain-containing protein [Burkholderia pseudomallei]CAK0044057.1 Uncharacterised protein [Burkholderia pseudomallei]CFB52783.1 Uncharacterised protein [Burkholderia pseudomallei]CFD93236.1 Uncharacterised protein [Burkholderia pseudomallei]CFK83034.1 Uncharacterised protein [Burkholderia pseudomallei]